MAKQQHLTRREQQVMEVIFSLGEGTVNEVREKLPDSPSYSAIRAALNRLLSKGELVASEQGPRYVYSPATNMSVARKSALRKIKHTFFGGSSLKTLTALLGDASDDLTKQELEELEQLIINAKRRK